MGYHSSAKLFAAALERRARTMPKEKVHKYVRLVSLTILRGVVFKTPVDTGRARNAWEVFVGAIGPTRERTPDPSGSAAMSQGATKIAKLPPFPVVYIVNPVEYIVYLEDGSSKTQAPQGMVKVTLEETRALLI